MSQLVLGQSGASVAAALGRVTAAAPSTLLTGLLAWWTLNEASGDRADSSGNGKTMIQTGTISGTTGFGNMGAVSVFDASTSNFLATGAALFTSGSWSVAGWFYRATDVAKRLFSQRGASDKQTIQVDSSHHMQMNVGAGAVSGTAVLGATTWYHMAATYDGTTMNLYLAGSATPDISTAQVASYTGVNNVLLGLNTGVNCFGGNMVGWGVWSKVLSTTEISTLYGAGNGSQYPWTGLP